MSVSFFDPERISLGSVIDHILFTRARLAAHPLTQGMVADWDDQLQKWKVVAAQELAHQSAQAVANATVRGAGDDLGDTISAFAGAVLTACKGDRKTPVYKRYFGLMAPSALKRAVLGRELETVKGWVDGLKASSDPALASFGPRFESLVAAGTAAEEQASKADAAMSDFRRTGARLQFFDGLNALRKLTDGKLAEMPHAMPAAQLPKDFADRFFWRPARSGRGPSAKQIRASIADAEKNLAGLRKQLVKAEADEKAVADGKAQRKAAERQKKLDAARKRLAEDQAELAALEAEG
jgi:hypothetical protein